jgi:hypothetical protein
MNYQENLSLFSQIAKSSDENCKNLNYHFTNIEEILKSHSPSRSCWCKSLLPGKDGIMIRVGYARIKNVWKIVYKKVTIDPNTGKIIPCRDISRPVTSAPKWIRAKALGMMPELIAAVICDLNEFNKLCSKSAKKIGEFGND